MAPGKDLNPVASKSTSAKELSRDSATSNPANLPSNPNSKKEDRDIHCFSPVRSGMMTTFATVGTMIMICAIGLEAGFSAWIFLPMAAFFACGLGLVITFAFGAKEYIQEQAELRKYSERLESFNLRDRGETLSSLRLSSNSVAGRISSNVHRLLTEVYQGYAESNHLRRTIKDTIEKETEKATNRLGHIAYIDGLTGLSNRRAFDETMPAVFSETMSDKSDSVLLTIDIDYFKEVNDYVGHDRGDEVLKFLADSIRSVVRDSDTAFRLGGDEFVIFLINVSIDESAEIAHRLQCQFAQLPWSTDIKRQCPKPTLSIGGVSTRLSNSTSMESLQKYSDEAMYGAKRAGKGCENIIGASSDSQRAA